MTGPCSVPIGGVVEPGFEAVRRVFLENFSARGEVGAACCVYWRGRAVVDLWGGWRDRARRAPWERDTLALVFSATKGMASAAMAVAHARGLFELDEPVARSWPDFAQGGKARVTVRQLMDHQAGLAAVRTRLTPGLLADPESLGRALACERPCWDPGARHGYHGLTLGWYQSELLRRVDPRGRTLGRYFAEEVAAPLGAEFYIGLPGAIDPDRLAAIVPFRPWHLLLHMNTLPARAVLAALTPGSLTRRSFFNPRLRTPADLGGPELRSVEIPSGNGFGTARALARVYAALGDGGRELGLDARTFREITDPPRLPPGGARDLVLHIPTGYRFGFMKPGPCWPYGSSSRAFGCNGAGGSTAFADPDRELAFAYVPSRMGFYIYNDPRELALRRALESCLGAAQRRDGAA